MARHLSQRKIAVSGAKTLLKAHQPDGFDCPGGARPDRDHTSTFEFCENGAKAVAAEATTFRASPDRRRATCRCRGCASAGASA